MGTQKDLRENNNHRDVALSVVVMESFLLQIIFSTKTLSRNIAIQGRKAMFRSYSVKCLWKQGRIPFPVKLEITAHSFDKTCSFVPCLDSHVESCFRDSMYVYAQFSFIENRKQM